MDDMCVREKKASNVRVQGTRFVGWCLVIEGPGSGSGFRVSFFEVWVAALELLGLKMQCLCSGNLSNGMPFEKFLYKGLSCSKLRSGSRIGCRGLGVEG